MKGETLHPNDANVEHAAETHETAEAVVDSNSTAPAAKEPENPVLAWNDLMMKRKEINVQLGGDMPKEKREKLEDERMSLDQQLIDQGCRILEIDPGAEKEKMKQARINQYKTSLDAIYGSGQNKTPAGKEHEEIYLPGIAVQRRMNEVVDRRFNQMSVSDRQKYNSPDEFFEAARKEVYARTTDKNLNETAEIPGIDLHKDEFCALLEQGFDSAGIRPPTTWEIAKQTLKGGIIGPAFKFFREGGFVTVPLMDSTGKITGNDVMTETELKDLIKDARKYFIQNNRKPSEADAEVLRRSQEESLNTPTNQRSIEQVVLALELKEIQNRIAEKQRKDSEPKTEAAEAGVPEGNKTVEQETMPEALRTRVLDHFVGKIGELNQEEANHGASFNKESHDFRLKALLLSAEAAKKGEFFDDIKVPGKDPKDGSVYYTSPISEIDIMLRESRAKSADGLSEDQVREKEKQERKLEFTLGLLDMERVRYDLAKNFKPVEDVIELGNEDIFVTEKDKDARMEQLIKAVRDIGENKFSDDDLDKMKEAADALEKRYKSAGEPGGKKVTQKEFDEAVAKIEGIILRAKNKPEAQKAAGPEKKTAEKKPKIDTGIDLEKFGKMEAAKKQIATAMADLENKSIFMQSAEAGNFFGDIEEDSENMGSVYKEVKNLLKKIKSDLRDLNAGYPPARAETEPQDVTFSKMAMENRIELLERAIKNLDSLKEKPAKSKKAEGQRPHGNRNRRQGKRESNSRGGRRGGERRGK